MILPCMSPMQPTLSLEANSDAHVAALPLGRRRLDAARVVALRARGQGASAGGAKPLPEHRGLVLGADAHGR